MDNRALERSMRLSNVVPPPCDFQTLSQFVAQLKGAREFADDAHHFSRVRNDRLPGVNA
jgi:hypothetical protein